MGSSRTFKKPLNKSVAKVCIIYTVLLCVSLCVLNYFMQRNALYKRYEQYISDILYYVDHHIDDEDLFNCIETNTESEKYKQTLLFMDQIMNDFSIHYLYCLQPINLNETGNVKVILSAEDDYNRYVDTEGNLYLGWVSDDEYDLATDRDSAKIHDKRVKQYFYPKDSLYMGVENKDYKGYAIPIYNLERMLVELIRYKSKLPFDYYKEIILNFRKMLPKMNIQKIQDYALALPKSNKILETLQMEVL